MTQKQENKLWEIIKDHTFLNDCQIYKCKQWNNLVKFVNSLTEKVKEKKIGFITGSGQLVECEIIKEDKSFLSIFFGKQYLVKYREMVVDKDKELYRTTRATWTSEDRIIK